MSSPQQAIESRLEPDARMVVTGYTTQYTTDLLLLAYARTTRRGQLIIRREDILAAHDELALGGPRPSRIRRFLILFIGGVGAALLEIGLDQALDDRRINSVLLIGVFLAGWAIWQQITLGDPPAS